MKMLYSAATGYWQLIEVDARPAKMPELDPSIRHTFATAKYKDYWHVIETSSGAIVCSGIGTREQCISQAVTVINRNAEKLPVLVAMEIKRRETLTRQNS
jgi:hypothetical protein